MIRASMDTRHFTFEAFGHDEEEARHALRDAWDFEHIRQYPDSLTFDEYIEAEGDDVQITEIEIGGAYRDNERMDVTKAAHLLRERLRFLHSMGDAACYYECWRAHDHALLREFRWVLDLPPDRVSWPENCR